MKKKILIMGIETSCDETAVSIIQDNGKKPPKILANIISSQEEIHKKYGGVVPELAARNHLEKIDLITKKALKKSKIKLEDLDAISATAGPGLIVCLSVGFNFAKALSIGLNKPLIAVNHLEGHALSPMFENNLNYPYLLLLISGGHTQFLIVNGLGKYKRIGTTIDDALGEAFDKTAKLLGFGFPGGPEIEKFSKKGDAKRFLLPKPIINRGGCNLSFAGLKTAVLRNKIFIKTIKDKYDLAASFQATIMEIIYKKTKLAIKEFRQNTKGEKLVVAGGVAANKEIRKIIKKLCLEENFKPYFPIDKLCGDNAAMIAITGLKKFKKRKFDKLDFSVKPRWALDNKAKFLKGSGIKL
tara:strand:+ start:1135 stop:2202 length:1068 start_codon:yes stop_codon:yes gene_type:complete